jgi:multidrug efflux system outer membrane protein
MKIAFAIFALINILASCVPPTPTAPPDAALPPAYRGDVSGGASLGAQSWESLYTDPVLQALIDKALKHNLTVAQAYASVLAAEANLGIVKANQNVFVNGALQAPYQITTGDKPGSTPGTAFGPQLGISASYQIDLFGKLASATATARAQLLATSSAANVVVATLVSQVASAYFQLRELDATLTYSLQAEKDDEENVRLVALRVKFGESSIQDQYQAQQALYQVTQNIPTIREEIGQTENALSVLEGDYPHDIPRGRPLVDQVALPVLPSTGLPGELLERRPDIVEAEATLVAADANIDVARKALYPSLTFGVGAAVAGQQVSGLYPNLPSSLAALVGGSGVFYGPIGLFSLIPQLTQSIFSGGALQSQVRLAKAQQQKDVAAYLQSVEVASQDVSNAVIAYNQSRLRTGVLQQNTDVSALSLKVAQERYDEGETSYLEVLNAQTLLYNAQILLEQARFNERNALVQLYLALGGGWQG